MYDIKEIEKIVKQKRKLIITEFAIIIALMIVALVLLIVNINSTVTFICIVAEWAFMLYLFLYID